MAHLRLPKEKTFTGPALLWKRIAAFLIDIVVLNFTVLLPFQSLMESLMPQQNSFSEIYNFLKSNYAASITAVSITASVLVILYFVVLERKMSQSIGKKLMNIYVAADDNKLTTWRLFVRNIVFIPVFPFILLWIIDPLFMFFSKSNQRLSEILSKTKVMQVYNME